MLTVRDLETIPVLSAAVVVAGFAGLDRAVRAVNVMEVPDIEAFIRPDELLLTTAYPLRDRQHDLPDLLTTLHANGLAALAIKLGRYLTAVPPEALARADELGFPILLLPDTTSFNEVIDAVLAIVLAEYGAEPARAEAIRERLTGVALAGGGLEEIARTLAGALRRAVVVSDQDHLPLGASNAEGQALVNIDQPSASAAEGSAAAKWWTFPITIAGSPRGQILVDGASEPTLGQRRLIRQACFAAGMHIAQAVASVELDRRLRALFLEDLVSGAPANESVLRERGRLYGWDSTQPYVVALADAGARTDGLEPPDLDSSTLGKSLPPGSTVWSRGREIVAFIAWHDGLDLETVAARWQESLGERWSDHTVVACGTVARSVPELSQSHAAARESLGIAKALGQRVVTQHMVTLERLLLSIPVDRLDAFVASEIRPLVELDRTSGSHLCKTLEGYLATGNAAEAARALFVHYNTMKHRLGRIEEVLSVDLRDPRTRLNLAVALRIFQLR